MSSFLKWLLAVLIIGTEVFAVARIAQCQTNNFGVDTAFTVTSSSTPIFSNNSQRGHVFVQNTGLICVFCGFGTQNNCNILNGRMLVPGAYFEYTTPAVPKQDLCCVTANGLGNVDAYQTTTSPNQ